MSILTISDQHAPCQHPGIFDFLSDLNREFKPKRIVGMGDEVDSHSISRHPVDPSAPSPGDELKAARVYIKTLGKIFPKMTLVESNHTIRPWKRAFESGLPQDYMKPIKEVLEAPAGWNWMPEYLCKDFETPWLFHHGEGGEAIKRSQSLNVNVVQGHYHEKFYIQAWTNAFGHMRYGVQAGCLIDTKAYAFAYGKHNIRKSQIGTCIIVDGEPILRRLV